jgi:hypothetical protein
MKKEPSYHMRKIIIPERVIMRGYASIDMKIDSHSILGVLEPTLIEIVVERYDPDYLGEYFEMHGPKLLDAQQTT